MTSPPPQYGQPPYQLFCWGEVTIDELPFVWHCVVLGATVVHCGAAAATGAIAMAADAPAVAKSVRTRNLVRMVGLLWARKTLAAAPAATDNQRWAVELVIPRIQISRL